MSAVAHVAHTTCNRVRLRFPSMKRDEASLARIVRGLRRSEAVTDVAVCVATGSVLVRHRNPLGDVLAFARANDLFEVGELRPEPLEGLRQALLQANDAVRHRTNGRGDLKTLAFVALLGGSAYQMFRGDFLPAGGTMLMQALDIVLGHARQDE